jgi:diketogulonate reductase-like aldo/keto reductase
MNTNIYTQRKNSPVLEVAITKATPEELTEINNELSLGFSQQELFNMKKKKDIQPIWNYKPLAKHGLSTAAIKPSKEKFKSMAKKSTVSSKPTLPKLPNKSGRLGV